MTTTATTVRGLQLRPGDTVLGLDGAHLIHHFSAYPGRFHGHGGARVAHDAEGTWHRTVADSQVFHVAAAGSYPGADPSL
jgi:hypothetical protein